MENHKELKIEIMINDKKKTFQQISLDFLSLRL